MDIIKETKKIEDYIIKLRREFHRNPELALQEFETSKIIKRELNKIGVDYVNCGETGIVATIGNGQNKKIALRADMDALKIDENTGVEYASLNKGVMHACGHDSHMASLIGATIILKKYENELPGKIVIIFQAAEENSTGAKIIIENGHLEKVDEIFGLHVFGDMECGKISIEKGYRMAASHKFKIYIKGKSGHAGKPHQCVDATLVCASIVMGIQSIVSREIDPIDPAVVTIGHMVSGASHNIISGDAFIEGTVRMFSEENAKKIETSIKRIAYSIAKAHGAIATIEYNLSSHPAVYNDEKAVNTALKGARNLFNEEDIISVPKMMLGEDFSVYQKNIPGVFAFVGGGNEKRGINFPNHNEKFNIDERAILISMQLYLAYVLEAIK